jgi:Xaa-Pro aminopeptidase
VAQSEFEVRCAAAAARLPEHKLDVLLVSGEPNIRYLTGFTGDNGLLLIASGRATLITDPRYQIQAALEVACKIRIAKGPLVTDVVGLIRRAGWKRIGYEPARMYCNAFESLKSALPMKASLEPAPAWIEELRMVKSAEEIALIRRSVATNSLAFDQAVGQARAGMKEYELAAELEYRMRSLGAEKPSFDTIVAAGARSALPHARPGAALCRTGDLVVVDMGATQDGYCSDMTRMLHLGRPSAKTKQMYGAVLEAQLAAIDAVKAGATTAHVDRMARRVLKAYGLDRAFVHSTGHGLGLEIHEAPRIGRRDKNRLRAGMAITIEPGVYLEGFGGVRIEDTVVVTAQGCEILTPTSKELRIV